MRRDYAPLALIGLSLAAAGCDLSGDYERRFQEAIQTSSQRAFFDQYVHTSPTDATDAERKPTGVSLRLPTVFDDKAKPLTSEPRAQPPFVNLPGFSYSLERLLDDPAGEFAPVYVYFAAAPKADNRPENMQADLARQVAGALPGASWSDVQVKSPDGRTVSLKRLRGDGQQNFDNEAQGKPVTRLDGRFDLYFVEGPNHYMLIGFRAPKAQAEKYQFDTATEAALGTVQTGASAGG